MEGDQGAGAPSDEPQAESAAASDSFSQLWTDVMGMLVSFFWGGGVTRPQADMTDSSQLTEIPPLLSFSLSHPQSWH